MPEPQRCMCHRGQGSRSDAGRNPLALFTAGSDRGPFVSRRGGRWVRAPVALRDSWSLALNFSLSLLKG